VNDMLVGLGEPCIRSEAKKTGMLLLYTYVACSQPNLLGLQFCRWGYLSRAGLWDKSHLTRQIEKYDTSYISHFEGVRERQEEECLVLAKQQL
jgi:hypothetical protein